MKYTIYNPESGEILYTLSCADPELAQLNLANKHYVLGDYSGDQYYVDQQQVVAMPARPQGFYDFDYSSKQWIINIVETQNNIRYQRNLMLNDLDRVGAVWYNSLTTEQQSELAVFRQALLDVPQQSEFPTQVNWPSKPAWL